MPTAASCWSTPAAAGTRRPGRRSSTRSRSPAAASTTCATSSSPTTTPTTWASPARWPRRPARPCGRTPDHAHLFDAIREPDAVYARRLALRARRAACRRNGRTRSASMAEELDGVEAAPEPDRELSTASPSTPRSAPLEVIETPGHAPTHVCPLPARAPPAVRRPTSSARVFTTYGDWGYSEDPTGDYRASIERVAAARRRARAARPRPPDPELATLRRSTARLRARLAAVARPPRPRSGTVPRGLRRAGLPVVAVWNFYETAGYLRHLERR